MINCECRMTKQGPCNTNSALMSRPQFVIFHFLDRIPDLVHFYKIDVPESFAARLQFVLQSIETGDEFVSRSLQRAFCIEFAFPCEIDRCKEQIPYFVFDRFPILLWDGLL